MGVRGVGPFGAQCLIVGEAPGREEVEAGVPFVGAAGKLLDDGLNHIALPRTQVRIENVIEERPVGNKLATLSDDQLAYWMEDCRLRLMRCPSPRVIIPLGNLALNTILGGWVKRRSGKRASTDPFHWQYTILRHRGYPQPARDGDAWILPMIHPAALFRTPEWKARTLCDWERVAAILRDPHFTLPTRKVFVCRTGDDLDVVPEMVYPSADDCTPLGVDIETAGPQVLCVGMARGDQSIIIPTADNVMGWGDAQTAKAWPLIKQVLAHPMAKAFHNGLFDTFILRQVAGIDVHGYTYDTMYMHHLLATDEEHSLEHCASLDAWCAPFKQTDWKDIHSIHQRCGMDTLLTAELAMTYAERLRAHGMWEVYKSQYAALLPHLLDLTCHGVHVDPTRRHTIETTSLATLDTLKTEITAMVGHALHAKKGLSNLKLQRYFYEELGCKPFHHIRTKRPTVDEVAVRRLMRKYPKAQPVGALVLQYRATQKRLEFVSEVRVDSDGRMRAAYSPETDTGRLASKKNALGSGTNAQNQDRDIRDIFVPDDGCVFVEVDASQGESRILGMLSGDAELVAMALTSPARFDVHRFNASVIFGIDEATITKEQRYLGKRAVHASNYGMEGGMLSTVLAKEGIFLGERECQGLIDAYLHRFLAIEKWQQSVRIQLMRSRMLANSWGRILSFEHARLDSHAYKRAYAFGPQSELAGLVNCWGFVPMACAIKQRGWRRVRINIHCHDALILSAPPPLVGEVMTTLTQSLSRPRVYGDGTPLAMPLTYKVGTSWHEKDMVEWNTLPHADDLHDTLARLVGSKLDASPPHHAVTAPRSTTPPSPTAPASTPRSPRAPRQRKKK